MINKLQTIREKRKNKKNVNPEEYTSLKDYAIDCLYYGITSQAYGPGAQKVVKNICGFKKETKEDRGDYVYKNKSIEYKFSIANHDGGINFVQLRPSYKVDFYILSYYDPKTSDEDTLENFVCRSRDLYLLLPEFGGYAHGTISENGRITNENILKNIKHGCEYALRPNTKGLDTQKPGRLLKKLREINLIEEEEWTEIKKKLI